MNTHADIGKKVQVNVTIPYGAYYKTNRLIRFQLNYGVVIGKTESKQQNAYIYGVKTSLQQFKGIVIAIIHRLEEKEYILVVAEESMEYTKDSILLETYFFEKYYRSMIYII